MRVCVAAATLLIAMNGLVSAQTTAPAVRSADAIQAEIESAHHQFMLVVKDPADIADPDRRKAVAPQAIPR